MLQPFVREAGSGPGVICLHANASSSSQWRGLLELLEATHHVFAPDTYGSGKSPDWASNREISLRDEVEFIEPVKAFAALNVPILYMLGDQSPESGHAVSRILIPVHPQVRVVEFPGLGHMGPVTHPDVVNAEIARFLAEDHLACLT